MVERVGSDTQGVMMATPDAVRISNWTLANMAMEADSRAGAGSMMAVSSGKPAMTKEGSQRMCNMTHALAYLAR